LQRNGSSYRNRLEYESIAKFIYDDSDASAVLVRNKDNFIMFDDLAEGLCETLKDGRKTVNVIEVSEEKGLHSYEVPLEMKEELQRGIFLFLIFM
jgi:hypothetical protein